MLKNNGFTLIELIIVIAILGILAFNVVPRFADINLFRNRAFGDEVLSSLRHAHKLAIAMGCDIQVSSAGSNVAINLRQSCTSGSFTLNVRDPATGASNYNKSAPPGIVVSSASLPLFFDGQGRAHPNGGGVGNATVSVGSRVIQVIGETGFVYEP